MVHCKECLRKISRKAKVCIFCEAETDYGKDKGHIIEGVLCICLGLAGAYFVWNVSGGGVVSDLYVNIATVATVLLIACGAFLLVKKRK